MGKITPARRIIAEVYTDQDYVNQRTGRRTWLNAKQSYLVGHPHAAIGTAAGGSYKTFKDPDFQNLLQEKFEEKGFGPLDRAVILSDIGRGKATRKVRRIDKEGNVIEYDVSPSYKDQLTAIKMANTLDGTDSLTKTINKETSDKVKKLMKEMFEEAQDSSEEKDVSPEIEADDLF